MVRHYVPDSGDIVSLSAPADPAGRAIQKGRPALVLSPAQYNRPSGLALVCPITNTARLGSWEVRLPPSGPATGVILSDQVSCIDWTARRARLLGKAPPGIVEEVRDKLAPLLGLESP